ncbi:MAG: hypothetical protein IJ071_02565 [Ruminococcus sp.]|nr:hypothetical protein [Ruminococcus sp.]
MNDEMLNDLKSMKNCEKLTNTVFGCYLLTFGLVVVGAVIIELISFAFPVLDLIFEKIILRGAAGALGILGVYKERSTDLYALAPPLIMGVTLASYGGVVNMGLMITAVILFFITLYINKKMRYLKDRPGYPYFSELATEQEMDRRQRDIKDEYQQFYEKTVKNSSEDMDVVERAKGLLEAARQRRDGGMDEIGPRSESDDLTGTKKEEE